jgi:hypothetical protein
MSHKGSAMMPAAAPLPHLPTRPFFLNMHPGIIPLHLITMSAQFNLFTIN